MPDVRRLHDSAFTGERPVPAGRTTGNLAYLADPEG
jgi:hypothetical protein